MRKEYGFFLILILIGVITLFLEIKPAIGKDESVNLVEKSRVFSEKGEFKSAIEMLEGGLKNPAFSTEEKKLIEWEIERLRRVKLDYSLTEDELFKELDESVRALTKEEFLSWQEKGYFDCLKIDGKKLFVEASVSNLFFAHPELRDRRKDEIFKKKNTEFGLKLIKHLREIKKAVEIEENPYVLPVKVRGEMKVTPKEQFVKEGKKVRCWIPFPHVFPLQPRAELISSYPAVSWLAQPQSLIRSAYLEDIVKKNTPLYFSIKYEYEVYSFYQKVEPEKVIPYYSDSEAVLCYLKEQSPHIVFLPKFKEFSKELLKGESNPYFIAQKIYNWISENIYYSYAREYSTLLNIPEMTFDLRRGDCGMEALLFITLCRMNGVAARWQSAWEFMDDTARMHDWAEIYLEPYGWLPVDQYMAIFAMSGEHNLTQAEKEELRDFYFCGIDHFRMVANKGQNQTLYPPKNSFRSETVDFQRGEIECENTNLYFGEFNYEMKLSAVLSK